MLSSPVSQCSGSTREELLFHNAQSRKNARRPPLPLRWRINANLGAATNRYCRMIRDLEQQAKSAEDAFELAHFGHVLHVYARDFNSIS